MPVYAVLVWAAITSSIFKHNSVVKGHVEPEALGRDLGALKSMSYW